MTGPARAALVLAGLGATLGVALDGIHTHFGATEYTDPVWWRMAWYVPLIFAGAFAIGAARPVLARAERPATTAGAVAAMGLFAIGYFASVLPLAWPLVAVILFALFAAGWALFDRTALGLAICAAGAIGGPLVEAALVRAGVFRHLHPVVLGVSGWLPFLYMVAGVGLQTLARRLARDAKMHV